MPSQWRSFAVDASSSMARAEWKWVVCSYTKKYPIFQHLVHHVGVHEGLGYRKISKKAQEIIYQDWAVADHLSLHHLFWLKKQENTRIVDKTKERNVDCSQTKNVIRNGHYFSFTPKKIMTRPSETSKWKNKSNWNLLNNNSRRIILFDSECMADGVGYKNRNQSGNKSRLNKNRN